MWFTFNRCQNIDFNSLVIFILRLISTETKIDVSTATVCQHDGTPRCWNGNCGCNFSRTGEQVKLLCEGRSGGVSKFKLISGKKINKSFVKFYPQSSIPSIVTKEGSGFSFASMPTIHLLCNFNWVNRVTLPQFPHCKLRV